MVAKGTILVVDNESDQLEMMKKILGRIGFDARTTDNPRQALQMVSQQSFNLVFIDLIMPDIDGTELCEQIKRIQPEAGIYAYSGHAHLYRPEQLKRAGFAGTINKPATMDEIKSAVSRSMDPSPAP
jgi:DNA-binding NtrC family response regulator